MRARISLVDDLIDEFMGGLSETDRGTPVVQVGKLGKLLMTRALVSVRENRNIKLSAGSEPGRTPRNCGEPNE